MAGMNMSTNDFPGSKINPLLRGCMIRVDYEFCSHPFLVWFSIFVWLAQSLCFIIVIIIIVVVNMLIGALITNSAIVSDTATIVLESGTLVCILDYCTFDSSLVSLSSYSYHHWYWHFSIDCYYCYYYSWGLLSLLIWTIVVKFWPFLLISSWPVLFLLITVY